MNLTEKIVTYTKDPVKHDILSVLFEYDVIPMNYSMDEIEEIAEAIINQLASDGLLSREEEV